METKRILKQIRELEQSENEIRSELQTKLKECRELNEKISIVKEKKKSLWAWYFKEKKAIKKDILLVK